MKKIFMLLIALFLCGCSLTPGGDLDSILKEKNYIIVDVREKNEFDEEHIRGAVNIPYDTLTDNMLDKSKTIIVYCKSGGRSKIAYNMLKSYGYDVYDAGSYENMNLEKE